MTVRRAREGRVKGPVVAGYAPEHRRLGILGESSMFAGVAAEATVEAEV